MNVTFYTPLADKPEIAYAAILQAEDEEKGLMTYIPVPLVPEPMDEIMDRGFQWLMDQIPLDFPVFLTIHEAEGFTHEMSVQVTYGIPHPVVVGVLLLKYRGEWHSKAEYGYNEYEAPRY